MPRTRSPYPGEFREQIVALARTGRCVKGLAREFEPCAATIHGWVKQADRDGGRRSDGPILSVPVNGGNVTPNQSGIRWTSDEMTPE